MTHLNAFKTGGLAAALFTGCVLANAAWAQASAPQLERCTEELGTLAVAEPQAHSLSGLSHYGLGSPAMMLRRMVQESGCFAVVERGAGMQSLQQERALAAGGQLQEGSNIGGGQMQAADFVMTAAVQFSGDTGGAGAVLGGLLGRSGGVLGHLGVVAGGVKFREAETTLVIADVRSGIQVVSADGKASKMNFSLGGWGWAGVGWAAVGGYTNTPEGKLIAASLLDNYNRIVQQIRDKPQLIRNTVAASQRNAAAATPATPAPAANPSAAASYSPSVAARAATLAPLPPVLVGTYSGHYSGVNSGTFLVMVHSDGSVQGTGLSAGTNTRFEVSGIVAGNGMVVLTGLGSGGAAQFSGQISLTDGSLAGNWRAMNGQAVGQFSGQKMR